MTDDEQATRGMRAAMAWDEFVQPAIEAIAREYMAAMTAVAAHEPWQSDKIVKLAVATRVIDKVQEQLRSAIMAGDSARAKIGRAHEIEQLPARKRKWIDFA